jgi:import inner membrane translocase subunit TIM50
LRLPPSPRFVRQYYEIVVFTDQLATYGDPILERLDPNRYISYRLYRDATQYTNGVHVRDLRALNRDPSRVVFVSATPGAYMLQPENALAVKPWALEKEDTTLLDLMPFLESMVRRAVPDTRAVLSSYAAEVKETGKDVPSIFRERSAQMQAWMRTRDAAPRPLLRGFGARGRAAAPQQQPQAEAGQQA